MVQKRQQNIKKNNFAIIKKFYKPFLITYILFSVAISFYPSFNFFSLNGQLILLIVSIFNGILGMEHGNSMKGKDGEIAVIEAYKKVDNFKT